MSLIADIDVSAFARNLSAVRKKARVKLCAVIKADAYGHGAEGIAAAAEPFADELAVADIFEAAQLKKITKPVLILGPLADAAELVKNRGLWRQNFIPTVCDLRDIRILEALCPPVKSVNLKINTGMNRLGVRPKEVCAAAAQIERAGYRLHSVFSHLHNAADTPSAQAQLNCFKACTASLPPQVMRHIAASACMVLPQEFCLDAVRPGLALYGYGGALEPVMKVHAPILKIFAVQKGEHISYGEYTAPRDMLLAVIGAGYADGIRRKQNAAAENRFVSINGALCPFVGQVCMDSLMADATYSGVRYGDRAYLLGNGVSGEKLAEACQTNIYEILTAFKGRVKRRYAKAESKGAIN